LLTGNVPLQLVNLTNLTKLNICNVDLYATDAALLTWLSSFNPYCWTSLIPD